MINEPTVAKELALLFIELSGQCPTPSNMPRTTKIVKDLLEFGYTDEEIAYAIRYAFKINKNVYSIGYVSSIIDKAIQQKERAKLLANKQEVTTKPITNESEVESQDDVAERNRGKSSKFGIQSRKRKKHYFDMFEGE